MKLAHTIINKVVQSHPLIYILGSGNGLAAALGGATPTEAAFAIIKGIL
jgi:hypothetical protein